MAEREQDLTAERREADALGVTRTRDGYDAVADDYAAHFTDELAAKPLDRALLTTFAELMCGQGVVADVGCGPGHVARYLHDRGLPVLGIDLSPVMVAAAQRLQPDLTFGVASMLELPVADGVWGGIVAFYAIVHLPPAAVSQAFAEFHRVLRPGGRLLLSFHIGAEIRHLSEWWGQPVDLDFHFFATEDLTLWLTAVGFAIEARIERAPYAGAEVATQRGYLLARKSDAAAAAATA